MILFVHDNSGILFIKQKLGYFIKIGVLTITNLIYQTIGFRDSV